MNGVQMRFIGGTLPFLCILGLFGCMHWGEVRAGGLRIGMVGLVGQNIQNGTSRIRFDVGWNDSWRMSPVSGLPGHDAVWVFARFRVYGGVWQPCHLASAGHGSGSGTPLQLSPGLVSPLLPFHAVSNPVVGLIVTRSQLGQGVVNTTGLELVWNYRLQALSDTAVVEVAVHGIEMVYIPGGPFWLGSGGDEPGRFYNGTDSVERRIPFGVGTDSLYFLSRGTAGSPRGIVRFSQSAGITGGTGLPSAVPVGYQAYYMMKYELSQSQYRDFLNDLTYSEQHARTEGSPDRPAGSPALGSGYRNGLKIKSPGRPGLTAAVFGCDANLNGIFDEPGDGMGTACNFLTWADVSAYLDWAGLRPPTEGEFEKACRGEQYPIPNEYPWGTADAVAADSLLSPFSLSEQAVVAANCIAGDRQGVQGPARVGAVGDSLAPRSAGGQSWHGVADLAGNVREWVVELGHSGSNSMRSVHGDGYVGIRAVHDVQGWPSPYTADGMVLRGGGWADEPAALRVSFRDTSAWPSLNRAAGVGGRGVRSVLCALPAALTDTIVGPKTPDFDSYANFNVRNVQGLPLVWQLPGDMEAVAGQGSDSLQAYTGRAYGTIRVAACNDCGFGPFAELSVTGRSLASGGEVSSFVGDGSNGISGMRYVVHVFKQSGVFRPNLPLQAEWLIVGGGGGGGQGGGGAGGYIMGQTLLWVQDYPVVVGTGGIAGRMVASGGQGSDSHAFGWRALGGGGGGAQGVSGLGGGSGGGAGASGGSSGMVTGGQPSLLAGTSLQGTAGGSSTVPAGGAGGGGAVSTGSDGLPHPGGGIIPGAGGSGVLTAFTGEQHAYAGGGGGGRDNGGPVAPGGLGGGGSGGGLGVVPGAGLPSTGSGGGGAGPTGVAGQGGSGLIVVRYILQ